MTVNLYCTHIGNNELRITFYNDEGDNFWYDMPAPFDDYDFFWYEESLGYAKLYFINEAPVYKNYAPYWVKQGCGWI